MIEHARTAWFAFTFLRDVLLGPDRAPAPMTRARRAGMTVIIFALCLSLFFNVYLLKEKLTHHCPTCAEATASISRLQAACEPASAPNACPTLAQPHIVKMKRGAAKPAQAAGAASTPEYSASDAIKILMDN